jgi:hypothetical protein
VAVGLVPILALKTDKRPVVLTNARKNGIETSVLDGTKKMLTISEPIIFRRK